MNSAPGSDLINNYIIKLLPEVALEVLVNSFNLMITDGSFPSNWKEYFTTLIPKPGNKGVRPISLASCTLKLLEKLVKSKLEKYIELDYILPNSQFGFRRGRSCEHCLSLLNLEIYKSYMLGMSTGAIFLDIEHMTTLILILYSIISTI